MSDHPDRPAAEPRDTTTVPVVQEELHVGRRRVETGKGVRVTKTVDEQDAVVDEPLVREEVHVERVAVNRPVDGPQEAYYDGDTLVVPVVEEVLVTEKRLVLKEEIRITRSASEYRDPQHVTLKREHAQVERLEGGVLEGSADVPGDDSLLEQRRRQDEALRRKLESGRS